MRRAWIVVLAAVAGWQVAWGTQGLPASFPVGPDSIWRADLDLIAQARSAALETHDSKGALLAVMRATGAAPAAVAFTARLGTEAGYLMSLQPRGPVLLGTVFFPFRANENLEAVLIARGGLLIWPASQPDPAVLAALRADPRMRELARAHPGVSLWPCADRPGESRQNPDGEQALRFDYPLRACRACPEEGTAQVSYQFGTDGTYRGSRLVSIEPR